MRLSILCFFTGKGSVSVNNVIAYCEAIGRGFHIYRSCTDKISSLFSQVFFPLKSRNFCSISQMNELKKWTFLCIWYENRWFRVHKIKRLAFSLYMALSIAIHLWQQTSRLYQDHQHFCRVLTSFVPPAHIQGASLAPVQGLALWKIFLPATGSFFL